MIKPLHADIFLLILAAFSDILFKTSEYSRFAIRPYGIPTIL